MQAVRKLTRVNRLLADLAGLAVIGRLIKPLMTDHLKCRPLTIALSDCRGVPSYCEGFSVASARRDFKRHPLPGRWCCQWQTVGPRPLELGRTCGRITARILRGAKP